MPLPKVLTNLGAAEQAAARSLANVKTAVDPLLQLCNSTFAVATDGSLSFLRRIKTFTANTINATTTNTNTLTASGAVRANGDFFGSGRLVAVNSGFKTYIPMGFYYNGSYTTATGYVQTVQNTQNTTGTTYLMPLYVNMPFYGSIVGISALYYGQTSAVTSYVQIRGASQTPTLTFSGAQPYSASVSFARGLYPVVAQQALSCYVQWNTAGNNLLYCGVIVEWDT